MREKGKVVELAGFVAKVSLEPSEACKDCPSCNLCRPAGDVRIVEVENKIGANVGDEVYIEISPKVGLIAVFLLFGLPVILGLVGLLVGNHYSEIHSVIFAIAGFALGLIFVKIINDILGTRRELLPYIVKILSPKSA